MEAVYVGWLSIIPAVVAIGLALLTKEVILSLVLGIFFWYNDLFCCHWPEHHYRNFYKCN